MSAKPPPAVVERAVTHLLDTLCELEGTDAIRVVLTRSKSGAVIAEVEKRLNLTSAA